MNTRKTTIWVIAAAAVLVVLLFIFHHREPQQAAEAGGAIANITITTIQKKDVNDYYEAAGTIQAKTISVISSRIMGTVTDVLVRQGDKVSAGQELLLIDNNDLAEHVKASQASYNEAIKMQQAARSNKTLAETTYSRYKQLYDEKAVSGQEMDQITNQKQRAELDLQRSQASAEAAKARLEQAKVNLGFSRITSPVDGVVTQKNIDKGSMATPGTPLLTVEDHSAYKAELSVNESMVGEVSVSMPVDVVIDSIAKTFKGIVTEAVPSIDTSSRTFTVKAVITEEPNEHSLRSGLYARVLIPRKNRSVLAVPASAIVKKGQLTGVYVVTDENKTSYRMIRTGKTFGDIVEVLSGLNEGERAVTAGAENIYEGETVGGHSR